MHKMGGSKVLHRKPYLAYDFTVDIILQNASNTAFFGEDTPPKSV
jgi:hypothetical protein